MTTALLHRLPVKTIAVSAVVMTLSVGLWTGRLIAQADSEPIDPPQAGAEESDRVAHSWPMWGYDSQRRMTVGTRRLDQANFRLRRLPSPGETATSQLRLPTTEWVGPHTPKASSRLWKRVKWEGMGEVRLSRLLESARQARAAEFTRCRFCGQEFPPGRRHETDVCHGCAERHLGVVH